MTFGRELVVYWNYYYYKKEFIRIVILDLHQIISAAILHTKACGSAHFIFTTLNIAFNMAHTIHHQPTLVVLQAMGWQLHKLSRALGAK